MTKAEGIFLAIIREALHSNENQGKFGHWHELNYDLKYMALSDSEWKEVLEAANKQSLLPLVYDAAAKLNSFEHFKAAHPKYFEINYVWIAAQMRKTEAFLKLYRNFLSENFAPIVVKGIICRSLYGGKGELRPSGDEDILIEKKDFEKAADILKSCGYKALNEPDKNMNTVQEITFSNTILNIELHINPFGTENDKRRKMNDWFRDVFQSSETVNIQNVPIRTMMPEEHLLFLVFHAFKHFTGSGAGIRMMLDILLFTEKYYEEINWNYIEKGLKDINAAGFMADIISIGKEYLGFEFSVGESIEIFDISICPDELLEDMLEVGIFGKSTAAYRAAGRIANDAFIKHTKRKAPANNKAAAYFKILFPSWRTWTERVPYLTSKPWCLPQEWFKRVVRFAKGQASSQSLKDMNKGYEIAAKRIKLIDKYR